MDRQPSCAPPDAEGVLKFVTRLVWRSKWLIGAATLVAASVAFALAQPNTVQAWTGKTILTIGLAPPIDYVLQGGGSPLAPIETRQNMAARISDPIFRKKVVNQATFEPATAGFSRAMVSSSLRGIAGESDRDVAVELTAGSAADVQAAFRALAAEVGQVHGDILNRRLQPLRARIEEAKDRIALIEKSSDRLNDRIFNAASNDKNQVHSSLTPSPVTSTPAWNELHDRIQNDTNLTKLSEPSVLHLETDTYPLVPRSVEALRASLLAGLAMLMVMIALTIIISPPVRVPPD
jgi:hypothetical protein